MTVTFALYCERMKIFRHLILFMIFLLLLGKATITVLSLEISGTAMVPENAAPYDWSEEPVEEDDSLEADDEVLNNAHPIFSTRMADLLRYAGHAPAPMNHSREVTVPPPQV